jgi:large subunit ribosomal protein L25
MLELAVEKRDRFGKKAKALLDEGKIPAIWYGKKEPATPIAVSLPAFLKVWREAGESAVIELTGLGEAKQALIHEVDLDPVKDAPRHADFYIIEKGQKVEVAVPLDFVGVAPAVKELGGVLVKVVHELLVEAEPASLPHSIEVDIAPLANFDSQILVRDIALPRGVEARIDPEEVVALVQAVVEEVESAPESIDLSQVEVERKGKQEEEAESSDT